MDVPAALAALQRRARTEGAEPLLTHYDLAGGGRTELSVATFANWVNKTANLIEDVGADAEHPQLCGRCVSNLHGEGEPRACA